MGLFFSRQKYVSILFQGDDITIINNKGNKIEPTNASTSEPYHLITLSLPDTDQLTKHVNIIRNSTFPYITRYNGYYKNNNIYCMYVPKNQLKKLDLLSNTQGMISDINEDVQFKILEWIDIPFDSKIIYDVDTILPIDQIKNHPKKYIKIFNNG
jgi:hypothetical protein